MAKIKLKDVFQPPKPYGTVTVGTKGQIVLPSGLRKKLNIKPGDQLFVVLKFDQLIGLIRANDLRELHASLEREMKAFNVNLG